MSADYSEADIVIHDQPLDPRFDWRLAESWAETYHRPVEWLKRAIFSCREAGVCPTYIRDRYLLPRSAATPPLHEGVQEAMKRMVAESRDG